MKKNSCIVVTGANGLAGSAMVKHLRDREFTCVVPLTRADCDLRDTVETVKTICAIKPDYIFHAAATVYGLQGNMDNQGKSIFENTLINTNVVQAAYRSRTKKIVVMGTNAVYPWPAVLPYDEKTIFDGRPHRGEAGYAHAKRHMLAMLEAYCESYGLRYTYLVSGNLYGPRDRFNTSSGHVLPSLVKKFHDASLDPDEVVTIWGDGSASRDFLYSGDLADIGSLMMGNFCIGAVNIGSGEQHTIREVATELSIISGVSWDRVVWDTSKPTGRPDCYADLSILHDLGYRPKHDLAIGLRKTWQWFEQSLAA